MIVCYMAHDGGFTVGDSVSRITAYAYPTSEYATLARRMPDKIAAEMIKSATMFRTDVTIDGHDYDSRNWARLDAVIDAAV